MLFGQCPHGGGDKLKGASLTADPYQVHAYIISSLKKDMPSVFGKEKKQKELIKGLDAL